MIIKTIERGKEREMRRRERIKNNNLSQRNQYSNQSQRNVSLFPLSNIREGILYKNFGLLFVVKTHVLRTLGKKLNSLRGNHINKRTNKLNRIQTISYSNLIKRERHLKTLESKGFIFIHKKNYLKLGLGIACLSLALIPNGLGLIFYPLGFMLLSINKIDLYNHKENIIRKIKNKMRFLL